MEQYVIKGGNPLVGEVDIAGAKNAALAILSAAIMTDETILIENLPDVRDINVLLEAISEIGAQVERVDKSTVKINGSTIGNLSVDYEFIKKIREEVGFDLEVVAPATHDTGSAVLAVPANDDDFIYISSGTWSLMGIERKEADCSEKSCEMNFTNEGGYAGRFRYLKNIMGLWMIQSVRHEVNDAYSFAEICAMAEEAKDFPSRVDANDECFLSPENMTKEVQDYCRRTGQKVPETLGEIATVIYTSLAECYAKTAKELEEMTGRTYSRIHIVGGGSNAGYLNELTAKATKKEIHAGPGEATAIGNITAQMLKAEEFKTIEEARTTIHESFGIKVYKA